MVLAKCYLRIREDVLAEAPLTAGFKLGKDTEEEIWVQVCFEKLADFCVKCEGLTHLTNHCPRDTFEQITMRNGLIARTYGPWLHAKKKMLVPFGLLVLESQNQSGKEGGRYRFGNFEFPSGSQNQLTIQDVRGKGQPFDGDRTNLEKICTVEDIDKISNVFVSTKRKLGGEGSPTQKVIITDADSLNLNAKQLAFWAKRILEVAGPAFNLVPKEAHLGTDEIGPSTFLKSQALVDGSSNIKAQTIVLSAEAIKGLVEDTVADGLETLVQETQAEKEELKNFCEAFGMDKIEKQSSEQQDLLLQGSRSDCKPATPRSR